MLNSYNCLQQPCTPGPISSELVTPDYNFTPPYHSDSITTSPELSATPAVRYVPSSPNELPNGSSYYPGQDNVFGSLYSSSSSMTGSVPQSVFPIAHVSQTPYQHMSHLQPLPLPSKCLTSTSHQCARGQAPAVSQQSPLPVNTMQFNGVPQTPWVDNSGYFGVPVSQSHNSHHMDTNSKSFRSGLRGMPQ